MIETRIYVGLNDSDTHSQKYSTEKYIHILKNVCRGYKVPFSFSAIEGGYMHENGEYTQEVTLVISLIDVPKDTVSEIAKDLCVFFHQESVLITEDRIRAYFINDKI